MSTPELFKLMEEAQVLAVKIEDALARRDAKHIPDPESYGHCGIIPGVDTEGDAEDSTEPTHLIGDGDGVNWTTEFCERNPSACFDYMNPWFMNAIYTGRMVERQLAAEEAAEVAGAAVKKHRQELRDKEKLMPKEKVEQTYGMAREAFTLMSKHPELFPGMDSNAVAFAAAGIKGIDKRVAEMKEEEVSEKREAESNALREKEKGDDAVATKKIKSKQVAEKASESPLARFPESIACFFGDKVNLG